MTDGEALARAWWRKSSFSGAGGQGGGNCVEVAPLADGRIAVRNSNHPERGAVLFTRAELHAWLEGVKAGEFDDLVQPTSIMPASPARASYAAPGLRPAPAAGGRAVSA